MHWLPVGGQLDAVMHWTHVPVALQSCPPPWLHAVPWGALGLAQFPPVQVAGWHWLPLGGQSPADKQPTQVPLPSQTVPPPSLQEVPVAAKTSPHVPLLQAATLHWLPVGGQLAA